MGDRAGEAITLNNIGLVYDTIGLPQEALTPPTPKLPIQQTVGDRAGEAITLNNIGMFYQAIDQPQEALRRHQELYLSKRK